MSAPTTPDRAALSRRRLMTGAIGLGGLTLAGSTAACTPTDPPTDDTAPSRGATAPQRQLGPAVTGPIYPAGYVGPRARDYRPFSDRASTVRIVVPQDTTNVGDWNTNHFSRWLEQRTGLKVQYEAVLVKGPDGTVDLTKINAMIASGEVPDAFLGIPFSPAQISLYGQQGLFVELGGLFGAYAPELRQMATDYPDLVSTLKSLDGRIYQMKGVSDCYHCHVSPGRAWVHQDHLAAVGATMPTTTDELRELLKLFKDKDPSGTGRMVPLAAGKDNPLETYFMNSFLETPAEHWITLNAGRVVFVADKPEWREGLRYLRSLYDDGTLTTSTLTATIEENKRAGDQNRIGVARAYYAGMFATLDSRPTSPWARYVALPPVKGPNGVQKACWTDNLLTGIPLLVTNKCHSPELLVQWGDTMFELQSQLRANSGDQEATWGWAEQGETGLTGKQAVYWVNPPVPVGHGWGTLGLYYSSKDHREGSRSAPGELKSERVLLDATKPYEPHKPDRSNQLPQLIFDDAAAAEQATLAAAIRNHVQLSFAEFCTGKQDINDNASWQKYLDTLAAIGVQRQVELYQRSVDTMPR